MKIAVLVLALAAQACALFIQPPPTSRVFAGVRTKPYNVDSFQLLEPAKVGGVVFPTGTVVQLTPAGNVHQILVGADMPFGELDLPRGSLLEIRHRPTGMDGRTRPRIGELYVDSVALGGPMKVTGVDFNIGDVVNLRVDGLPIEVVLSRSGLVGDRELELGDHVYVADGRIQFVRQRDEIARRESCHYACRGSTRASCVDWCLATR